MVENFGLKKGSIVLVSEGLGTNLEGLEGKKIVWGIIDDCPQQSLLRHLFLLPLHSLTKWKEKVYMNI